MNEQDWLAEQFEEHRRHLRAVAYRMLGSLTEADDALQEAWIRLSRSDTDKVENMGGWLTTIVARVCLNMLRSRKARAEEPLGEPVPEPIISSMSGLDPEQEALVADSVGLALLVVLDSLTPPERLAFVLHDMFAVPFDEIAPIISRSPAAARQLGSRARRRVQGAPVPDPDLGRQQEVLEAFLAASQEGDFEALVAVLDPDVVLRTDRPIPPGAPAVLRGAQAVAKQAWSFRHMAPFSRWALVNGAVGAVVLPHGEPFAVLGFTVSNGKIVEIDVVADPDRLRHLDLTALDD